MFNIRKGIFETNSSSTHSICIAKNNNYEIPEKLNFAIDEFGWKNEVLYGATELASYLYTGICELYEGKELEDYKNYIFAVLGENNCKATFEEPKFSKWGGLEQGYMDHSEGLIDLLKMIRHSEKRLLRFLFSPDSFIITGNDNEDVYFKTVGETDFSNVEVYEKDN